VPEEWLTPHEEFVWLDPIKSTLRFAASLLPLMLTVPKSILQRF